MSASHRAAIATAQRRAWLTRARVPIGTTRLAASGYVMVKVAAKGRWRHQHLLVIEAELGRPLAANEHVHHINGIKSDNRRENLHLFASNSDHTVAHRSLEALLDELLRSEVIGFDRSSGRYLVYDRLEASRPGRDSVDQGSRPLPRSHGRIEAPRALAPRPTAVIQPTPVSPRGHVGDGHLVLPGAVP